MHSMSFEPTRPQPYPPPFLTGEDIPFELEFIGMFEHNHGGKDHKMSNFTGGYFPYLNTTTSY